MGIINVYNNEVNQFNTLESNVYFIDFKTIMIFNYSVLISILMFMIYILSNGIFIYFIDKRLNIHIVEHHSHSLINMLFIERKLLIFNINAMKICGSLNEAL